MIDAAKTDLGSANKELVREMYAVIESQDFDRLRELLHEDFTFHLEGLPEPIDRDGSPDLIRAFYAAFPDYTHLVRAMVAEGDRVAVRLLSEATHQGEFHGIPATGAPVSYAGVQFFSIVDGMIKELWALDDNLALMSQLGMQLTAAESDT